MISEEIQKSTVQAIREAEATGRIIRKALEESKTKANDQTTINPADLVRDIKEEMEK